MSDFFWVISDPSFPLKSDIINGRSLVLMDTLSTYLHSVLFYKQRFYKKLLKIFVYLRGNCDFFLNLRNEYKSLTPFFIKQYWFTTYVLCSMYIKFRYCEKATEFEKISHLFLKFT